MRGRQESHTLEKFYGLVLGIALLFIQTGCGRIDENPGLVPGAIIYSAPLGLKSYELETGEERFVLQLVDEGYAYANSLAKVDNRHIIAAIPSPESSTAFHLVDINKGTRTYLAPGYKPVYYPEGPQQGKLAYYSNERSIFSVALW